MITILCFIVGLAIGYFIAYVKFADRNNEF